MFAAERKGIIIELIEQKGSVEINELAKQIGVVPETIRRDLKELERQNIIQRTHGGAIKKTRMETEFPVMVREMKNSGAKNRLCQEAARHIQDGDLIFVDNSSTMLSLIRYIDDSKKITILTNSVQLLLELCKYNKDNITMISTGGIFRKHNMSLSGLVNNSLTTDFFPGKAFVSCYGFSFESGFTDGSIHEIDMKRQMMHLASEVFVIMDHSKFDRRGPVRMGDIRICDTLIVDSLPSEEYGKQLCQIHPELHICVCNPTEPGKE